MVSAAEQLAANLNFGAFAKAEELKKRIWFTLGALVVYRIGTYIPIPGINPVAFAAAFQHQSGGILGMINMFSGGAIERMAIFALNIMPYISASIIMQLMQSVVPSLEALKKEGEQGRKQLNQYTRYLTVFLAGFQAFGIAYGLQHSPAGPSGSIVATWTHSFRTRRSIASSPAITRASASGFASMTKRLRSGSWISTICQGSPGRRSLAAPSITPSSDVMLWGSFVPQP